MVGVLGKKKGKTFFVSNSHYFWSHFILSFVIGILAIVTTLVFSAILLDKHTPLQDKPFMAIPEHAQDELKKVGLDDNIKHTAALVDLVILTSESDVESARIVLNPAENNELLVGGALVYNMQNKSFWAFSPSYVQSLIIVE